MTEGPEVWRHGPVFNSLYNSLSYVGGGRIITLQRNNPLMAEPRVDLDDIPVLSLIGWIWDRYGHFSGFDLSSMTHEAGTPWQVEAERNNYRVPMNYRIPDSLIREYFAQEASLMGSVT